MRSLLRSLLPVLLAFLFSLPALADAPLRLTLLHINDVYQISPLDKGTRGGLARLASLRDQIKANSPHTLMTLGGDTLSPSVASNTFRGAQMIAAWNAAGLDMAVLGNHEFDFGPDVLAERLAESRFPWFGANVTNRKGQLPALIQAGEIRSYEGVKVGFLGVITTSTALSSKGGPDILFKDPIAAARKEAQKLRARGARVIVALTHLDMEEDQRLASLGIADLILGGHEHAVLNSLAGRTPILKAGSDARNAYRVDLYIDRKTGRLKSMDWELIPITAELPLQPATAQVVASYETQLARLLDLPVGTASEALNARQLDNRSGETNLGSWLAEVYRSSTGAEVAIVNGGSIRSNTNYGPGPLSKRDILSILPFENPIVMMEVSGSTLRAALEHGLSQTRESRESGRFPQVAGLRLSFDARQPSGKRLVEVTANGKPLEDGRMYKLAVNGYLAGGGDGYAMLKNQHFLLSPENALSETAEVIEALSRQSPLVARTDGRIRRLDTP